jgi:hypothetical protein
MSEGTPFAPLSALEPRLRPLCVRLYGYDDQGQLTTVSVDELNGQELATPLVTSYTYDADGNELTETLPDGEVTTYT